MATLFRPVGLHELSLIWDLNCRAFPPRLEHQPFFYPVANADYARQIATRGNLTDEASGYAGFLTKFSLDEEFLAGFQPQIVGTTVHREYWIPSESLPEFNEAIIGRIEVEEGYFGSGFLGFVPEAFGLREKNAAEQFVVLANTWDYSRMDFVYEVWANRKAIYLNCCFWAQHNFDEAGLESGRKRIISGRIMEAWMHHKIPVPLPASFRSIC